MHFLRTQNNTPTPRDDREDGSPGRGNVPGQLSDNKLMLKRIVEQLARERQSTARARR